MNLLRITALALLCVVVLADPKDDLIAGTRTFTAAFYKELVKINRNRNIVFSPLTIQTLLGLLASAAQNENDEAIRQIKTALSLPNSEANRQDAFKYILDKLNKPDNDFKVLDATKIYFKSGYTVETGYKNIAQNVYKADIDNINFSKSFIASRTINQWVAQKTDSKITNFTDYKDITSDMQSILINTLYLRGKWDTPFEPTDSEPKIFHGSFGAQQVTMMTAAHIYDYYEDNDAQYLKLELVRDGGDADMVFVLPKQQQGLNRLENNIQNLLRPVPFKNETVEVSLPKFSLRTDMKLKPLLENLGVKKLFEWGVVLKGIISPGNQAFQVTDVFQKAFIEVDEWGVTLATGVGGEVLVDDPPGQSKIFMADHPFLFYIKVGGAIVYAGRLMRV